jgi:acyl-CoA dehydrogenase
MSELGGLLDDILTGADGQDVTGPAWSALVTAGLTRVGIDPDFGGEGGDLGDAAQVITAAAYHGLRAPLVETLMLAGHAAVAGGLRLPEGNLTAAASPVPATRVNGEWTLSGDASEVAWADHLDAVLVLGRCGDGGEAIAAVLEADAVTVTQRALNLAGQPRVTVWFETVPVAAQWAVVPASLPSALRLFGAFGRTCELYGAMRRCLDLTVSFAQVRAQFGRPIAGFQVVQHEIVEMAGEVAATAAALRSAQQQIASPEQAVFPVGSAKVQASRAAGRVAALAHQVHGAIGLTAEYPLHYATTALWAWRDEYGGRQQWQRQLTDVLRTEHGGDLWATLLAE